MDRSGNRAIGAIPSLEQPVRWSSCRWFGKLDHRQPLRSNRRPVQRGGFTVRATGGEAASLCECTVSPCGFVERETGRRSRAGGAGAPCSEVGVFDSGNRKRARRLHGAGDPCMGSVFRPGNRGEDRLQSMGDPCSAVRAFSRATAGANERHGFGVHEWGPRGRPGNRAAARAPRIGKPKRGGVHCEGNFAGECGSGPTRSSGNRAREACTRQTYGPGNRGVRA